MAPPSRIGIIFHGIGTPARALEPGEAPYWIDTTRFEHVLDRIAASPRRADYRLSFDDGNASDHDIALPRLLARGLVADFFVLTDRIGQPGSLSADQIGALQAAGMGVGSHGAAHRDWRRLSGPELDRELSGSRAVLQALCGRPVTTLGIPFGAYDARVLRAIRAARYEVAYSSDRGRMQPDAFLRPRTSVRADMSEADLDATLAGYLPPLAWVRRTLGMARRRWFSA